MHFPFRTKQRKQAWDKRTCLLSQPYFRTSQFTEQHCLTPRESSAAPSATTSDSALIALTYMAVPFAVQGETNEVKSFLGWEPASPLPNAPCLGPLGAHSRIADVPGCCGTCLCVCRRQWRVSGLENGTAGEGKACGEAAKRFLLPAQQTSASSLE